MLEESGDESRDFLELAQGSQHDGTKLVRASDDFAPNGMGLDMLPDLFGGVQFRGIGGQEDQLQASVVALDMLPDGARAMDGVAVDDEVDWGCGIMHESIHKQTELLGIDVGARANCGDDDRDSCGSARADSGAGAADWKPIASAC